MNVEQGCHTGRHVYGPYPWRGESLETWRSWTTWYYHTEKTTGSLLVHWFWMSWWHMTSMDVQSRIPTEISRTHCPPMTLLSLTVFWKIRTLSKKTLHYLQLFTDMSDPVVFMVVVVNSSVRLYDGFLCLFFWHPHCEASDLSEELPEESKKNPTRWRFDQPYYLKTSVGLILAKVSVMRVTIPIDLSTWTYFSLIPFVLVLIFFVHTVWGLLSFINFTEVPVKDK